MKKKEETTVLNNISISLPAGAKLSIKVDKSGRTQPIEIFLPEKAVLLIEQPEAKK